MFLRNEFEVDLGNTVVFTKLKLIISVKTVADTHNVSVTSSRTARFCDRSLTFLPYLGLT